MCCSGNKFTILICKLKLQVESKMPHNISIVYTTQVYLSIKVFIYNPTCLAASAVEPELVAHKPPPEHPIALLSKAESDIWSVVSGVPVQRFLQKLHARTLAVDVCCRSSPE